MLVVPFLSRTLRQNHIASSLLNYSDSEILSICSTSPTAEAPDFVENLKRDRPFVNKEWQFISRSGSLSTRTLESRNQVGAFILPFSINNTRTKGSLLAASTSANQTLSHLGFKGRRKVGKERVPERVLPGRYCCFSFCLSSCLSQTGLRFRDCNHIVEFAFVEFVYALPSKVHDSYLL
ncbi:hypothetical protein JHK87_039709 [Glycine soja]|nr:hypothetical protein JHK87_039709 [Glycine soja]